MNREEHIIKSGLCESTGSRPPAQLIQIYKLIKSLLQDKVKIRSIFNTSTYTKISCMYYINLIPAATGTYFVIDCLARKLTTVSRSQFLKQKKSMLKYNNL